MQSKKSAPPVPGSGALIRRTSPSTLAHIRNVISLLKEESTVPFIARYRKEMSGEMDETEIRLVESLFEKFSSFEARKETVLKQITRLHNEKLSLSSATDPSKSLQQKAIGILTAEFEQRILNCKDPEELEDLYLPFKPKKQSLATIARELGLGEIADMIFHGHFESDRDMLDDIKFLFEKKKNKISGIVDSKLENVGQVRIFLP